MSIFDFFKSTEDESLEEQKADVEKYCPALIQTRIINALSCDKIPGATGEFGRTFTNPIPVNGIHGEIKYLNRLRSLSGAGLIFHRLGSIVKKGIANNIDVYETVSIDGQWWDILYFDMYHPRRSKALPKGYLFSNFHKTFSKLAIGFGVHDFDNKFPFGIPDLMENSYGSLGESFAKKLTSEILEKHNFKSPEIHQTEVLQARSMCVPTL